MKKLLQAIISHKFDYNIQTLLRCIKYDNNEKERLKNIIIDSKLFDKDIKNLLQDIISNSDEQEVLQKILQDKNNELISSQELFTYIYNQVVKLKYKTLKKLEKSILNNNISQDILDKTLENIKAQITEDTCGKINLYKN